MLGKGSRLTHILNTVQYRYDPHSKVAVTESKQKTVKLQIFGFIYSSTPPLSSMTGKTFLYGHSTESYPQSFWETKY